MNCSDRYSNRFMPPMNGNSYFDDSPPPPKKVMRISQEQILKKICEEQELYDNAMSGKPLTISANGATFNIKIDVQLLKKYKNECQSKNQPIQALPSPENSIYDQKEARAAESKRLSDEEILIMASEYNMSVPEMKAFLELAD